MISESFSKKQWGRGFSQKAMVASIAPKKNMPLLHLPVKIPPVSFQNVSKWDSDNWMNPP